MERNEEKLCYLFSIKKAPVYTRAFLMSMSLLAKSWQCTKLLPTWRSVRIEKVGVETYLFLVNL